MLRNALRKLTKKQNHRLTQAGGSLTNSFIYIKFLCCVAGKKQSRFPLQRHKVTTIYWIMQQLGSRIHSQRVAQASSTLPA